MHTPSPKYFCPRCKAAFDTDMRFCGQCGADMHRASGLLYRKNDPTRDATLPQDAIPDARNASHDFARSVNAPDDDGDPWLGRVIDNRYRVLSLAGHGGMGAVYRVEHQRMGKIAAMKVLHRELASDKEVVRRFQREAQAVSRLNHPNTVQVFDFGVHRGALYLVMEYVRGVDLGALVKRDGPIAFVQAAPLFHQICAALSEAHALGVIHRDLKPENVLVTRTSGGADFVKVLDFGLAKLTEREDLAEVTDSGSIVGTPYYMSPEQIRGEHVDVRSDIYSLGALMYRVLTGDPPYRAQSPVGVLTKHLTADLVPPSERAPDLAIDPRVDELVVTTLAKKPGDRFQSIEQLTEAISEAYSALTGDSSTSFTPSGGKLRRPSTASGEPAFTPRRIADFDDEFDTGRRLRREDLDAYERSLRRTRIVRGTAYPLLALGVAGGGAYYLLTRPPGTRTAEAEPNNTAEQATLIAADTVVTGYLGKRQSKTEADKDCFQLAAEIAPDGSQKITARATAPPNIDIRLDVYDAGGGFLARGDDNAVGGTEWVRDLRVRTPVYVVVTESMRGRPGTLPTENVSDTYEVRVEVATVDSARETEPNHMDADANPLAPGAPVSGFADRRGDIDAFRFDGPAGTYRVRVTGAKDTPLRLRWRDEKPTAERSAEVKLSPGDIIRVERDDSSEKPRKRVEEPEPYSLAVEKI